LATSVGSRAGRSMIFSRAIGRDRGRGRSQALKKFLGMPAGPARNTNDRFDLRSAPRSQLVVMEPGSTLLSRFGGENSLFGGVGNLTATL
jgi:hypothetical protein